MHCPNKGRIQSYFNRQAEEMICSSQDFAFIFLLDIDTRQMFTSGVSTLRCDMIAGTDMM